MPIPKLGFLGRTYRHAQRYRQILGVLLKYGFSDLVTALNVEPVGRGLRKLRRLRGKEIEAFSRGERLRRAFEELGPTFVKLGQILSTRTDLVPSDVLKELTRLQDDVPAFPFEEVKGVIERELESGLRELFADFDEQPLAAASIGQVHRAELRDGELVVVKVQRPGIRRNIDIDLDILHHLAELLEKLEAWKVHRPTIVVDEFARVLRDELDYRGEAAHVDRFAFHFKDDQRVLVPSVVHELTTSRVLTMERVQGLKASDAEALEAAGLDRKRLARRCADLTLEQIFHRGFFHADPHPGNVFLLPGHVVCYLDFGMVGRIDRPTRERFADLLAGIVTRDEEEVAGALLALTVWEDEPRRPDLERDLGEFMDRHFYRPLKEVRVGRLLQQLLELAGRHHLQISPELYLMIKALSSVEGLCRSLDPELNLAEHAAPFIERVRWRRLDPRRLLSQAARSGADLLSLAHAVPAEAREVLRKVRSGEARIGFEHHGLERLTSSVDQASNRLAFALVLAALVIGSSLIVLADIPPKWQEIPVVGLGGFVVAAVMGFWLLWSILKHGRM